MWVKDVYWWTSLGKLWKIGWVDLGERSVKIQHPIIPCYFVGKLCHTLVSGYPRVTTEWAAEQRSKKTAGERVEPLALQISMSLWKVPEFLAVWEFDANQNVSGQFSQVVWRSRESVPLSSSSAGCRADLRGSFIHHPSIHWRSPSPADAGWCLRYVAQKHGRLFVTPPLSWYCRICSWFEEQLIKFFCKEYDPHYPERLCVKCFFLRFRELVSSSPGFVGDELVTSFPLWPCNFRLPLLHLWMHPT